MKLQITNRRLVVPAFIALTVTLAGCAGLSPKLASNAAPMTGNPKIVRIYQIRHFTLDTVWAGSGFIAGSDAGGPFRAKLTLFFSNCPRVAELYFYDLNLFKPEGLHKNMDHACNASPGDYFKVHFPISSLDPILQQLHHSHGFLNLIFENSEWGIQTTHGDEVKIGQRVAR